MKPEKSKPQSFYDRAARSREGVAQEAELTSEPEKFERLQQEGRHIYSKSMDELSKAQKPADFGSLLDGAFDKIREIFPEDEYGERAREAAQKRVFEKAVHEIGDWLSAVNRSDLRQSLESSSKKWNTASAAGSWIEVNILSNFSDSGELFAQARDAKVEEYRKFYQESKKK